MELNLPPRLLALREAAKAGRDPTCADETLALLMQCARGAKSFLEIGAGEGLTSTALLLCSDCRGFMIEKDPARAARARNIYREFGVDGRAELIEGDAAEVLPYLMGPFDFIFLDGPKVQYRRYYEDCKRLLVRGGTLFSDDVLFLSGNVPAKRRMLAEHLREYCDWLCSDPDYDTKIYKYGEGLAVSVKR